MNGREVFKHAVKQHGRAPRRRARGQRLHAPTTSTWVVAHQANLRILEGVAERVGMPMERFFLNIDRYGNTSSASIPIALDEAMREGSVKRRRSAAVHGARAAVWRGPRRW